MSDCIFCQIIAGGIPSTKVYEDDEFIAFEDANPEAPVHTLIVPKKHYHSLNDDIPADVLGRLFKLVPHVAELKGVHETGYRTVANTGNDANQTVHHLHIHVIGGKQLSEHSS